MGAQPTIAMSFQSGETDLSGKKLFAGLKLLLSHWNWKAAVLSVSLRAPIFAVATLRRGTAVLGAAVLTETAVSVFNAGFYGSIVQLIRNRKPLWLTGLLLVIVIPALGQGIEFAAHAANHTPHREVAILASSLLSALSALFNWYAMQHDALLVAEERTSFGRDLKRLPGLILRFVWLGPQWIVKSLASRAKNGQRS